MDTHCFSEALYVSIIRTYQITFIVTVSLAFPDPRINDVTAKYV